MTRGSLGGADSPFEEAVTAALRRRGWTIVPQVGVSKFRIDLGIVHPDRPGDYLVGVECDGAAYHSAATARDRDKVRAAILEGLGWKLLRIWSTDWWIDKERAADKAHVQIEESLAADRQMTEERAAAAPVEPLVVDVPETDPLATEVPAGMTDVEPPAISPPVTPADKAVEAAPGPVYARRVEHPPGRLPDAPGEDLYRTTDFAPLAAMIDPGRFYDPSYDATLALLIGHVLRAEAPIAETLLVHRIARAHDFQRAGRVIRDRAMAFAERLHVVKEEAGGGRFVWIDARSQSSWNRARRPAAADDIRPIEDIALAELRAARQGRDAVEVARLFGVRRLSISAKARIEAA
jgi:very-short-patch-repair endonuclease